MKIEKEWLQKLPGAILLVLGAYLLLRSYIYAPPRHVDVAALQLHGLTGETLPASLFTQKPIVLNFWAPWCAPCRAEMPWLANLQRQHPEITVVGVEYDPDVLEEAIAMQDNQHPLFALASPNALTRKTFGHVSALPTTLYISRSGRVVHTITGLVPESVMRMYLADAIRHE